VPDDEYRFLSVKSTDNHATEVSTFLESAWRKIAPDDPYDGFRQDDVFLNFYNDNTANIKVLTFISGMAVTLGCLGLFGLVSFNITRRLKEFSVRKVFGANLGQIFGLMTRDYMWILIVAFGIGAPSGFFLMNKLIQLIYPDPQPTGALPFVIAISVMVVTVGMTVASQMHRVARENPTKTLRTE
jgi:ABC-type antimicrobial peptide transport system permease subunit